ncbi:hypothetical protein [Endozoicomonas montiporae]|uniref:hypothetical protein n=1 Tax=Endozoicomonas montiporae TaxID=1027273 RepID=UPI001C9DC2CE|nr:hypothetical protein [Endozoicomonas montiporae]
MLSLILSMPFTAGHNGQARAATPNVYHTSSLLGLSALVTLRKQDLRSLIQQEDGNDGNRQEDLPPWQRSLPPGFLRLSERDRDVQRIQDFFRPALAQEVNVEPEAVHR